MALTRYKLKEVSVLATLGSFTDVVKRVVWDIEFYEDSYPDICTVSSIETVLNTDNITAESFVPTSTLTQTQIIEWAKAEQGGDEFIDTQLRPFAEQHLAHQLTYAGATTYDFWYARSIKKGA